MVHRIKLFARLLSIDQTNNIDNDGVNSFVQGLRYLVRRKALGNDVKFIGINPAHTYSPYIRAYEYFKYLYEGKIGHDAYEQIKKEVETLKLQHGPNREWVIDDDLFLDLMIRHLGLLNKDKQEKEIPKPVVL